MTSQWPLPCAAPSTLDVDPALKQYVQRWYTRLRSGLGGHVSTKGREAPQRGTDRYGLTGEISALYRTPPSYSSH